MSDACYCLSEYIIAHHDYVCDLGRERDRLKAALAVAREEIARLDHLASDAQTQVLALKSENDKLLNVHDEFAEAVYNIVVERNRLKAELFAVYEECARIADSHALIKGPHLHKGFKFCVQQVADEIRALKKPYSA